MLQIIPDFSLERDRPVITTEPPKRMLTIERVGSKTKVKLNYSSLSILQACMRKSYYMLHKGYRSKMGSPALIYGQAIHKALEVFYKQPYPRPAVPSDFDDRIGILLSGQEMHDEHYLYDAIRTFIAASDQIRHLPETNKRSVASGVWTLCHYFKVYQNDTYVICDDENGPLVERSFSFPFIQFDDVEIDLFGTIDFVMKNQITGEILVGDHKTTSQMGHDFLNRIKPNHQYTGYLWLAQKGLGITSENFLVNGIEVKQMIGKRGDILTPPKFTRQITYRSKDDFEELKDCVQSYVDQYLRCFHNERFPLGPVDACSSYGGCQFLEVCSAPNALRENMLEAKFENT